mmetsp:Transcript_130569/g.225785  ORF Transcript_130569/g.225785 Transcript_130569/m.225785 type:complete len:87 (-) Transcript_130569:174-434(-)
MRNLPQRSTAKLNRRPPLLPPRSGRPQACGWRRNPYPMLPPQRTFPKKRQQKHRQHQLQRQEKDTTFNPLLSHRVAQIRMQSTDPC